VNLDPVLDPDPRFLMTENSKKNNNKTFKSKKCAVFFTTGTSCAKPARAGIGINFFSDIPYWIFYAKR
jgi:hypothetical protein